MCVFFFFCFGNTSRSVSYLKETQDVDSCLLTRMMLMFALIQVNESQVVENPEFLLMLLKKTLSFSEIASFKFYEKNCDTRPT